MSRTSPARFPLAPVALAAVVALCTLSAPVAHAQPPAAAIEVMHTVQLPAQPLGAALNELARQAKLQLLVRRELVEGKQAPAVSGTLTARQALQRLLAGSGLSAQVEGASVVVTEQPAGGTPEATLPAVKVSAAAGGSPTSSVAAGLMGVRPSAGLTRLPVPIRDQAQTIQIVPRESLVDRNVLSIHEAVETIAGVRAVSPAYASRSAGIRSRGFESYDSFVNGVRLPGFGVPVESANVESVEILKGASGVQFGLAEPGGALNIVTKRPVKDALVSVKATLGSYETRRLEVDLGGAIDPGDRVLTRLNLGAEANEEHRDFDKSRRVSVAPAFTWLITPETKMDLELGYLRNDYRFNRGLPPQKFIRKLPFDFSTGEPNQPLSKNESLNVFYVLEHQLGQSPWSLRQRAGAHKTRSDSFEINSGVSDIDGAGNLARAFYASYQREYTWVLQHELVGSFSLAGVQHKALFGFEVGDVGREYGFKQVVDSDRNPPALNVRRPVYGGYVFPRDAELQDSYPPETYGNRFKALYADWHATLNAQWKLQGGIRLDRTKGYYRTADGSTSYGAADSRGVSPRIGVVWTPLPDTDVFANVSTGFSPNLFSDSAGNLFDTPEKSRQFEAGVRHELVPDQLRVTASVFTITKRNVQTPDPSDPTGNRSVLTGEQRSDGLEVELVGALSPRCDVSLGYALTNARTTRHSDPAQKGLDLVDVPRHHLTLWTKYKLPSHPGLWVGYGMAHAGERRSSSANADFLLPRYTRHDLALGYAAGPWAYQVNLGNVTKERVYYTHGNNIHLQPGRNARMSLTYTF